MAYRHHKLNMNHSSLFLANKSALPTVFLLDNGTIFPGSQATSPGINNYAHTQSTTKPCLRNLSRIQIPPLSLLTLLRSHHFLLPILTMIKSFYHFSNKSPLLTLAL